MKIQGGGAASGAGATARGPAASAPGFAPAATGQTREAAPTGPLSSLSGLTSLDALLALQETPGPTERRRRAVRRAGRLLDVLDNMKLALLEDRPSSAALLSLKNAVADQRAETDDGALEGVLNEIETRALVELAKAEMAQAG